MLTYDKSEVREALSEEDIFILLSEWGGEPEYTDFGLISQTICHNEPGGGSRKLYYYSNSMLFNCYTNCGESFDIFDLTIKVLRIQKHQELDLNEAVRYIAFKFGVITSEVGEDSLKDIIDWKLLSNYERIDSLEVKDYLVNLKIYDDTILSRFNYSLQLEPWLREGISQKAIDHAQVGFFPGGDQITIPHFDSNGNLIGLRGRTMCKEDAERYGKYRPLKINKIQYSHPLGYNLYGLNWAKDNIKLFKKAIVVESEKAVLQYQSYFGLENNIAVACCGSNLSAYQMQLLLDLQVEEVIIAFDRQFQKIGDEEFNKLTANFKKIYNRYKNYTNISFIFDKKMITGYKDSPLDKDKETFLQLYKERITLK